jgi:RNA 2',3'-cyclic 3'-phosphodiesterase
VSRNDSIRTFICIEISREVRHQIDVLQDRLRRSGADVSWVRPANIHLTLKFLGNVPKSRIGTVCSAVQEAVQGQKAFPIEVRETGCFPSSRSPRVIWVGVNSPLDALKHVQTAIETSLERVGFAKERRPFSPHLTLGRMKSQRNVGRLTTALTDEEFEAITFQATEVVVMQSDLHPTGAVYSSLAIIPLLKPGD